MPNPQIVSNRLKKLQAFELRYQGSSIESISKKLKLKASTLSTYFSREWQKDYSKYADEQDEVRKELALSVLKRSVEKAAETLTKLLESPNEHIRFKSATEILNRNIGSDQTEQQRDPVEALLEAYGLMEDGSIIIDDDLTDRV